MRGLLFGAVWVRPARAGRFYVIAYRARALLNRCARTGTAVDCRTIWKASRASGGIPVAWHSTNGAATTIPSPGATGGLPIESMKAHEEKRYILTDPGLHHPNSY